MMKDAVKIWKLPMMPTTRLKNRTGVIIGTVMFQKRRQVLAPSISAASSSSFGTLCKPARKMIICGPMDQRLIRMKAGLVKGGLNSQATGAIPKTFRNSFRIPYCEAEDAHPHHRAGDRRGDGRQIVHRAV